MKLLKAVDAALTAFVDELWPVPPAVFSDEWFVEKEAEEEVAEPGAPDIAGKYGIEWGLESSSAPVVPPGVADESPGSCEHSRAPEPGHPEPVSQSQWACMAYAASLMALRANDGFNEKWSELADLARSHMLAATK